MANTINIGVQAQTGSASKSFKDLEKVLSSLIDELKKLDNVVDNTGDASRDAAKDVNKVSNSLEDAGKKAKSAEKNVSGFSERLKSISDITAGILGAAGISAGLDTLFDTFKTAATSAIDLESSLVAIEQTYAGNSAAVLEWANNNAGAYGLSISAAASYYNQFQSVLSNVGLTSQEAFTVARNATQLIGDISFAEAGVELESAFGAIRDFLSKGGGQLDDLGIVIEDAAVATAMLGEGQEDYFNSLSDSEKLLLRYNYLMQNTTSYQGVFADSLETGAAKMQSLSVVWENFLTELGEVGLPLIKWALNGLLTLVAYADAVLRELANLYGWEIDARDVVLANTDATAQTANNYAQAADATADTTKNVKATNKAIQQGSKLLDLYTLTFTEAASATDELAEAAESGALEAVITPKLDLSLLSYGEGIGTFSFDVLDIDQEKVKGIASAIKEFTDSVAEFVDNVKTKGFAEAVKQLIEDLTGHDLDKVSEFLGKTLELIGDLIDAFIEDPVGSVTKLVAAIAGFELIKWVFNGGLANLVTNIALLSSNKALTAGSLATSLSTLGKALGTIAGISLSSVGGATISDWLYDAERMDGSSIEDRAKAVGNLAIGIGEVGAAILIMNKLFGPWGAAVALATSILVGLSKEIYNTYNKSKDLIDTLEYKPTEKFSSELQTALELEKSITELESEYEDLKKKQAEGKITLGELDRLKEVEQQLAVNAKAYQVLYDEANTGYGNAYRTMQKSKGITIAEALLGTTDTSKQAKETQKMLENMIKFSGDASKSLDKVYEAAYGQSWSALEITADLSEEQVKSLKEVISNNEQYADLFNQLTSEEQEMFITYVVGTTISQADDIEKYARDNGIVAITGALEGWETSAKEQGYTVTREDNVSKIEMPVGLELKPEDLTKYDAIQVDDVDIAGIIPCYENLGSQMGDALKTAFQERTKDVFDKLEEKAKEADIALRAVESARSTITSVDIVPTTSLTKINESSVGLNKNVLKAGEGLGSTFNKGFNATTGALTDDATKAGEDAANAVTIGATSEFYNAENAASLYSGCSSLLSKGITSKEEAYEIGLGVATSLVTGIDNGLADAIREDGEIVRKITVLQDNLIGIPDAFKTAFENAIASIDTNLPKIQNALNLLDSYSSKVVYNNPTTATVTSQKQNPVASFFSGVADKVSDYFTGGTASKTAPDGTVVMVNVSIGEREIQDYILDVVVNNNNSVG